MSIESSRACAAFARSLAHHRVATGVRRALTICLWRAKSRLATRETKKEIVAVAITTTKIVYLPRVS